MKCINRLLKIQSLHQDSMEQVGNKVEWLIEDFKSLLQVRKIQSDDYIIGGCRWCLQLYLNGKKRDNKMSIHLRVSDYQTLATGWQIQAKFCITTMNHSSQSLSIRRGGKRCFNGENPSWGTSYWLHQSQLNDGYLVNGDLKIFIEVEVLDKSGYFIAQVKQEHDGAMSRDLLSKTPLVKETINVNGVQVPLSQAKLWRLVFEKHPDIAKRLCQIDPVTSTVCLGMLLGLMKTLVKLPRELCDDSLVQAGYSLTFLKQSGYKVDWLEKSLTQVKERKEKEKTREAYIQQLEEELEVTKLKWLDLETHLKKEKEESQYALSLDDIL